MNIDKIKTVYPNFQINSFHMFDRIISLKWETVLDYESWEEHKNLVLEMSSPDNYQILLECVDVDSFRFCGNGQISGLYIKDMSVRGYEHGSKYEVGDYEEDEIEFYCTDIIIKSFEKIE